MEIEEYAKYFQFYTEDIPELLIKYLAEAHWKSFLELGCGDGSLLYALNKREHLKNKLVYAIDLSENRINRVKKINENFICLKNSATHIKHVEDKSIEFLLSIQLIEHVENDENMIKEIGRILKKEGIVFLSTIFKKWYGWYFYRCNGKWTLDPTHLREYTKNNQLLDIFKRNSFQVIEYEKSLIYRPIIDFVLRRIVFKITATTKRNVFDNRLLRLLRNIKIPIPGYYVWEIVCQKK